MTRILRDWGYEDALRAVAAFPDRLQVRNAVSRAALGTLGALASIATRSVLRRIHRADMHRLLVRAAATQQPGVHLAWMHCPG